MKTLVEKFAFDTSRRPPEYLNQKFYESDGQLIHEIDGETRAIVPVESLAEYLTSPNISQALGETDTLVILDAFTAD